VRLDPSYTVVFGENDFVDIPARMEQLRDLFESLEPGSAARLDAFLKQAAYKYQVGIHEFVYKPSRSVRSSLTRDSGQRRPDGHFPVVPRPRAALFPTPQDLQLVEFPILFLGAVPQNTPALYSLMNYADMQGGTWYPMGGMHKIVEGMVKLAVEKGFVRIQPGSDRD
jgi:phytoene desaturase